MRSAIEKMVALEIGNEEKIAAAASLMLSDAPIKVADKITPTSR